MHIEERIAKLEWRVEKLDRLVYKLFKRVKELAPSEEVVTEPEPTEGE